MRIPPTDSMTLARTVAPVVISIGFLVGAMAPAAAQTPRGGVEAITPPAVRIPPEAQTADSTHFSFVVYGDTRSGNDGVDLQFEHSVVLHVMIDSIVSRRSSPDPIRFVLQSGDAVSDGTDARQWNVSFVPLIDLLTQDANVPYFLTLGNHDVPGPYGFNGPQRRAGVANYYAAMAHLIPPDGDPRRLAHAPAYAFGYGNTFVITFDTDIADDRGQFEWVKKQLEGLDRRRYTNVVVFFHHPVFSSGPHGSARVEPPTAALRTKWMPLFRREHVRLLFAGHDHLYEHWVEHYHDETGEHRIDQIVTAGGGAPPYAYRGDPDVSRYLRDGAADSVKVVRVVTPSKTLIENPYHFVVVHVDGDELSLEVIGVGDGAGFRPYGTPVVSLDDKRP